MQQRFEMYEFILAKRGCAAMLTSYHEQDGGSVGENDDVY